MSQAKTEPANFIIQSITALERRTRRSVSPWVQRWLNQPQQPRRQPLRMVFTAAQTRTLAHRISRVADATRLWRPGASSLQPALVKRFSQQIVQRFPEVGHKYELQPLAAGGPETDLILAKPGLLTGPADRPAVEFEPRPAPPPLPPPLPRPSPAEAGRAMAPSAPAKPAPVQRSQALAPRSRLFSRVEELMPGKGAAAPAEPAAPSPAESLQPDQVQSAARAEPAASPWPPVDVSPPADRPAPPAPPPVGPPPSPSVQRQTGAASPAPPPPRPKAGPERLEKKEASQPPAPPETPAAWPLETGQMVQPETPVTPPLEIVSPAPETPVSAPPEQPGAAIARTAPVAPPAGAGSPASQKPAEVPTPASAARPAHPKPQPVSPAGERRQETGQTAPPLPPLQRKAEDRLEAKGAPEIAPARPPETQPQAAGQPEPEPPPLLPSRPVPDFDLPEPPFKTKGVSVPLPAAAPETARPSAQPEGNITSLDFFADGELSSHGQAAAPGAPPSLAPLPPDPEPVKSQPSPLQRAIPAPSPLPPAEAPPALKPEAPATGQPVEEPAIASSSPEPSTPLLKTAEALPAGQPQPASEPPLPPLARTLQRRAGTSAMLPLYKPPASRPVLPRVSTPPAPPATSDRPAPEWASPVEQGGRSLMTTPSAARPSLVVTAVAQSTPLTLSRPMPSLLHHPLIHAEPPLETPLTLSRPIPSLQRMAEVVAREQGGDESLLPPAGALPLPLPPVQRTTPPAAIQLQRQETTAGPVSNPVSAAASTETSAPGDSTGAGPGEQKPDLDRLARQILPYIKRFLAVEQERQAKNFTL